MSKIGYNPITIQGSISIEIVKKADSQTEVKVKGIQGELSIKLPESINVEKEGDKLLVKRLAEDKKTKSLHGLYRSLLQNNITGVEKPWEKRLEVVGTGYNVKLQGEDLILKVGYSHPVVFKKVSGIKYGVEGNNKIVVSSADRQLVGQVAYQIKLIKKPDVYKGKGIRYLGEQIKLKPGKKAKVSTAA